MMIYQANRENTDGSDGAQLLIWLEAARIALRRVFEFDHDVLGDEPWKALTRSTLQTS